MKEFIKDNFGYIIGFFTTPVIKQFISLICFGLGYLIGKFKE